MNLNIFPLLFGSFICAIQDAKTGWVEDYILYSVLAGGVLNLLFYYLSTGDLLFVSLSLCMFIFLFTLLYLLSSVGSLGLGDTFLISSIALYIPIINIEIPISSTISIPVGFPFPILILVIANFLNLVFYNVYYMKLLNKKFLLLFLIVPVINILVYLYFGNIIYAFLSDFLAVLTICSIFSIIYSNKITELGIMLKSKNELRVEDYIVENINGKWEIKKVIKSKDDIQYLPEKVYVLEVAPRYLPFVFIALLIFLPLIL